MYNGAIMDNPNAPKSNQRARWWPPLVLLATGTAGFAAVQFGDVTFSGRPSVDLTWVVGSTEALLFVWLMRFSGIAPVARLKLLALAAGIACLVALTTCVEGYQGDGRPILAWRWSSAHATKVGRPPFVAASRPTPSAAPVDLVTTTSRDAPQFRGIDRSGIYPKSDLSTNWNKTPPRELWRQPIGQGWSSCAVRGDFFVTQEQRDDDEVVACYELLTGRERWVHRDRTRFHEVTGGDGPRATPTIDSGRVYSLGATGLLNCLDGSSGQRIWSRDILDDAGSKNGLFGMAGSPLVANGLVVVAPGGKLRSLVAYREETGEFVWGGGDAAAAYSSPVAALLGGLEQILIFNATGLFAHDWRTGAVLWSFGWITPPEMNNVCQPVPLESADSAGVGRVFVSSGYGKGCAVLAVNRSDGHFRVTPQWSNSRLKAKFSSVVVREGFVYGLDDKILTCLDLATGEQRWKGGRYGYGQLLLSGGVLLIQAEEGEVVLVEASPVEFRELTRFAALDHRTWCHPVLAGSVLVVRNDREIGCFDLSPRD
jgi:outer membrane protein assembly factor BamB